jgi:hypothetical protein
MPPGAESCTLPPLQKFVGPLAVIVAIGAGLTVTLVGAEVALQLPLVTCTLNVPLLVTEIDEVVAPLDQR